MLKHRKKFWPSFMVYRNSDNTYWEESSTLLQITNQSSIQPKVSLKQPSAICKGGQLFCLLMTMLFNTSHQHNTPMQMDCLIYHSYRYPENYYASISIITSLQLYFTHMAYFFAIFTRHTTSNHSSTRDFISQLPTSVYFGVFELLSHRIFIQKSYIFCMKVTLARRK